MKVCLQWTLLIFNTFSVVLGILGAVFCVLEMNRFGQGSSFYVENIVQIACAGALVLSAFVGCCGAINESVKVLYLYIFLLLGLMVTHCWKMWRYDESKLLDAAGDIVIHAWLAELVRPGGMSELQEKYECCGKESYTDYTSLGLRVPTICTRIRSYPYVEGCWFAVKRYYLDVYRYEKIATLSLIGFEFVGLLLSIVLICKFSKKSRRYHY